ncbi:MAG: NAD(+)/NADH kinase [Deltaproteobacteria bacterium]|nr:NAD(+)/NADH kinase [Deltaproteobacteria bacterium]MBW2418953.1 NAD(+)/NADH kinase [Deltaproteobacteria bacterium]
MKIRSVGVCLKPDQPQAAETVRLLVKWLCEHELDVLLDDDAARATERSATSRDELAAAADLIMVLGGDGTLLSVARSTGTRHVPILGVNLGTLGFLTEINVDEMLPALEKVVSGDFEIESRMRLEVVAYRGREEIGRYHALNDAVLSKTALSRMIDLCTYADGVMVTTYHADGLIVSTPTGSTAYSLSAGGPLLLPGLEAIVLTPICPHSLTHRPVVMPQRCEIEVEVRSSAGPVALTVDGQEGIELADGDRVCVRRSEHPVAIVASPYRSRYEILHAKLRWGER